MAGLSVQRYKNPVEYRYKILIGEGKDVINLKYD